MLLQSKVLLLANKPHSTAYQTPFGTKYCTAYTGVNLSTRHIDCSEHKGDMSIFHNFTGDAKETFELVL